jgi:hypothetical protein
MGMARKIERYNQAYQLAREYNSKNGYLNGKAGIVVRLHDAIRQQLQTGADDPVAIAAGAIRALQV